MIDPIQMNKPTHILLKNYEIPTPTELSLDPSLSRSLSSFINSFKTHLKYGEKMFFGVGGGGGGGVGLRGGDPGHSLAFIILR